MKANDSRSGAGNAQNDYKTSCYKTKQGNYPRPLESSQSQGSI